MKIAGLIALIAIPVLGFAEDNGTSAKLRRLESVTWNPVTEELTWVVSAGDKKAGDYEADKKETYLIHMDSATMKVSGEGRRFSKEEAENVHVLMDILSKYAVDSTVWWEHGEGQKLDEEGNPLPGKKEVPKETTTPAPETRRAALEKSGQPDPPRLSSSF